MFLEAGERQVLICRRVFVDLVAVELPEHANKDLPGRTRAQRCFEHLAQVVRLGFVPEIVEPPARLFHGGPVVASEVEFEVARKARTGQVGRTCDDPVRLSICPIVGREDVCFGVQERLLVASHLHVPGSQRRDQLAQRRSTRAGKRKLVSLAAEYLIHAVEARPHTPALEHRLGFFQLSAFAYRIP